MAFKLKNGYGTEHEYAKEKLKLPSTMEGEYEVFTKGEVQNGKSVTITQNGTTEVAPDMGYSSVKKISVTVNTPTPDLQEKSVTFTENKTSSITPDEGKDGLSKVNVTVNVPTPTPDLQEKSVTFNENKTSSITPDEGKDGLSKVNVTVNVPGTDFSVVTATQDDVLKGIKFYDAVGDLKEGLIKTHLVDDVVETTSGNSVTASWPAGYYATGISYGYTINRGLKLNQINTTYQSDASKQVLLQTAQYAVNSGQTSFYAPCWMIGVAFVISEQPILSILSVYVDTTHSVTYFKGGLKNGSVTVNMEMTGTMSSTGELSYTLDTLEVNGTEMSAMVTESTVMRLLTLESA